MTTSTAEHTFIGHLLELRDRLVRIVVAILVCFLALFAFANDIYTFVAEPLMATLPEGSTMIATQVASPFLTPFKLTLVASVFVAMPYLLAQLWGFIAPGLYTHEKRLAVPLLASSIALFYAGAAFAYFVVFPLVFAFLTSVTPDGVAVMTDISAYLDFVLMLFFAFGLSFEVPIATILLVLVGATTPNKLASKRPFVIVGAFVLGMFLTPPDIISQTLLAVPMWILFEIGVIFARIAKPNADKPDEEDDDDEPEPTSQEVAAKSVASSTVVDDAEYVSEYEDDEDDEDEYKAPSDDDMEAELDRIEAAEEEAERAEKEAEALSLDEPEPESSLEEIAEKPPVEKPYVPPTNPTEKLERVMELRDQMRLVEARTLLYEVLEEGDAAEIKVARNILVQLDGLSR